MAIYRDDPDRTRFLDFLERTCVTNDVDCLAFCLMTNHYHMVITTQQPNLSRAIQQLNFRYAQWWNHRHARPGHVFQGRFGAQVIQSETYLLAVCRYVVLNPVRAGLVTAPEHWRWSSYRGTAGLEPAPAFLQPGALWALLGAFSDTRAARRFQEFVQRTAGASEAPPREPVLGDRNFVDRFRERRRAASREVTTRERRSRPLLAEFFAQAFAAPERAAAAMAARKGGYTLAEIGAFLGVHYSTVSKMIRGSEA